MQNSFNKVVVVIPVHTSNPSNYEIISLKQCFAVLKKHPIKIVAPNNLNLENYKKILSNFEVIYIDPKWQTSLINYNKLKLSRYFYSLFDSYEYLLTYELDAFVFKDELIEWCNKNFDYIGAPWFEKYGYATEDSKIIGVGNSGFSLRKIKSIVEVLENLENHNYNDNEICEDFNGYEDYFISKKAPFISREFNIASSEVAYQFSFEVNPRILYELNKCRLPFGCHAWWRYDLSFWKPHIEKFGYKLK